ncbi:MAG: response regulator transcription factor [Bacteroidota bacterium]|nr:response regulator transcription factor [Bacteroidota bacterium]
MKLLLVEDDRDLGNVLAQYLEMQSFIVDLARTGEEGLLAFKASDFDLCILDILLPGMDGLSLARKIKGINSNMPILFLTARTSKEDILKGLKLGADDYVCKPFEPEELVLRINNILRRSGKTEDTSIQIGKLQFNYSMMTLEGYGESNKLTLKEAELLKLFLNNRNKVLKREDVLVKLWGENDYFLGRSLDVFISRLRKYMKVEKNVEIETIRGVGYLFKSV